MRSRVSRNGLPSTGWYALRNNRRKFRNILLDEGFVVIFSTAYFYVRVGHENRGKFAFYGDSAAALRVKDVDVERLISLYVARAASKRHPGTRAEGSFKATQILDLLSKQRGRCNGCACDIRQSYTVDHIIPRSRGGSNDIDNIQLLCGPCNSSKGDRTMDEWMAERFAGKEVTRRGRRVGEISQLEENVFLIADWIRRASIKSGQKVTSQILDICAARRYVDVPIGEDGVCDSPWVDPKSIDVGLPDRLDEV